MPITLTNNKRLGSCLTLKTKHFDVIAYDAQAQHDIFAKGMFNVFTSENPKSDYLGIHTGVGALEAQDVAFDDLIKTMERCAKFARQIVRSRQRFEAKERAYRAAREFMNSLTANPPHKAPEKR